MAVMLVEPATRDPSQHTDDTENLMKIIKAKLKGKETEADGACRAPAGRGGGPDGAPACLQGRWPKARKTANHARKRPPARPPPRSIRSTSGSLRRPATRPDAGQHWRGNRSTPPLAYQLLRRHPRGAITLSGGRVLLDPARAPGVRRGGRPLLVAARQREDHAAPGRRQAHEWPRGPRGRFSSMATWRSTGAAPRGLPELQDASPKNGVARA